MKTLCCSFFEDGSEDRSLLHTLCSRCVNTDHFGTVQEAACLRIHVTIVSSLVQVVHEYSETSPTNAAPFTPPVHCKTFHMISRDLTFFSVHFKWSAKRFFCPPFRRSSWDDSLIHPCTEPSPTIYAVPRNMYIRMQTSWASWKSNVNQNTTVHRVSAP